jgi:hypothetical protein
VKKISDLRISDDMEKRITMKIEVGRFYVYRRSGRRK